MTTESRDMQHKIDQLKASWHGDRSWDIEDTEGFEEHRDELRAYRLDVEAREAKRAAKEHEAAILKLMQPGLNSLPESDPHGGLTRGEAERPEHAANRLLRAVAAMILPVVEHLHRLDGQNDEGHLELANDIIRLSKMLP